jgi:hypothetical protein
MPNRHTPSPTIDATARSVRDVSNDPRHRLGALGERLAAEHLIRRGFRIVERNYRTRWGELDIVAFDGQTLAFCEVVADFSVRGCGPTSSASICAPSSIRVTVAV